MSLLSLAGSIGGSLIGGLFGKKQQESQYDAQKEFAQMGLQWKAADAKAAGLHPMAALGSTTNAYSPTSSIGGPDWSSIGGAAGDYLESMGQNTKRAQVATQTPLEREMEGLALERAKLQNRLLEGQVQNEWAALMGQPHTPPLPIGGGPATSPVPATSTVRGVVISKPGLVESKPSESISSAVGDRGVEAAGTPGFKNYGITDRMGIELPNQHLSESLEGMGVAGHLLGPALTGIRAGSKLIHGYGKPPDRLLPSTHEWEWSVLSQTWNPKLKKKKR